MHASQKSSAAASDIETDWRLGTPGDSCTSTCTKQSGGACVKGSMLSINSYAKTSFVAGLFNIICPKYQGGANNHAPSADLEATTTCYGILGSGGSDYCNASDKDRTRFCCCGPICPSDPSELPSKVPSQKPSDIPSQKPSYIPSQKPSESEAVSKIPSGPDLLLAFSDIFGTTTQLLIPYILTMNIHSLPNVSNVPLAR